MQNATILIPLDFVAQIEETVRKVLNEKNTLKEDKCLTSKDVMKLLHISSTTLQAWRDKNKIPFTQVGKKIVYSETKVLRALNIESIN